MLYDLTTSARRYSSLAVLLSLLLPACDSSRAGFDSVFGTPEPDRSTRCVDIVVDGSRGSPANRESLRASGGAALPFVATSPGGLVRVWVIGRAGFGDTRLVTSVVTPAFRGRSTKARRAAQERWAADSLRSLLGACEPLWAGARPRTSPLFDGLTKVAIATPGTTTRVIAVISDLREESPRGHWECGALPRPDAFPRLLHRDSLLLPGSLSRTRVLFTSVGMGEIDGNRCPVRLDRELLIQQLWTAVIAAAGGQPIFTDGPLTTALIGGDE